MKMLGRTPEQQKAMNDAERAKYQASPQGVREAAQTKAEDAKRKAAAYAQEYANNMAIGKWRYDPVLHPERRRAAGGIALPGNEGFTGPILRHNTRPALPSFIAEEAAKRQPAEAAANQSSREQTGQVISQFPNPLPPPPIYKGNENYRAAGYEHNPFTTSENGIQNGINFERRAAQNALAASRAARVAAQQKQQEPSFEEEMLRKNRSRKSSRKNSRKNSRKSSRKGSRLTRRRKQRGGVGVPPLHPYHEGKPLSYENKILNAFRRQREEELKGIRVTLGNEQHHRVKKNNKFFEHPSPLNYNKPSADPSV